MTTAKQIAANRKSAKKSTGPRSAKGKASSSQNALKHGLSAKRVVIWDEDPAVFEALRFELVKYFRPADPIAEHLVDHVAASIWRLRRVPEIEAGIYAHAMHESPSERQIAELEETFLTSTQDEPGEGFAKGKAFEKAEHSLSSLARLAAGLESSMYRAVDELERKKAEGSETANDSDVFDVRPEQEKRIARPRPRLKKALAAQQASKDSDQ